MTFNQQADLSGFFEISTVGSGTIDRIVFSDASNRPNLRFTQNNTADTVSYDNIFGNPGKSDTLVLGANVPAPAKLPPGFTGIGYKGEPTSILPNLKRLELAKIGANTTIKAVTGAPHKEAGTTLLVPFTTTGMPDKFYLKTSNGEGASYRIDFSDTERPDTTFEIAGGTVSELKNAASKNDRLVLSGGTLQGDISTIASLDINGATWEASGTFSNLGSININDEGLLTALNVGPLAKETITPVVAPKTLTVKTTSNQHMPVNVAEGGTLTSLNIQDGASLGLITGATKVDAGTVNYQQVLVGTGLTTAPTDNQHLLLNTPTQPVSISAMSINTLELKKGAKLGSTGQVSNLNITDNDWSVTGAIAMATDTDGMASIQILDGVKVGSIGVSSSAKNITSSLDSSPSPLNIIFTPKEGITEEKLKVAGTVEGNVDLSGIADSVAAVNFEQTGGSITGNITGRGPGKNDSLMVTGESSITGTITGIDNINFAGTNTFDGTITGAVNSVQITGQLKTLRPGGAVPMTISSLAPGKSTAPKASTPPTLDIATGGKLIIDRPLNVVGSYHQNGEIDILATATSSGTVPAPALVTASTIDIGPDARVVFDSSNSSAGQLLMTATEDINQTVTVAAEHEQYEHFTAILKPEDKRQMVLAAQPMGAYVSNLARSGGAPASAVKALEVAANPKNTTAASTRAATRTSDPLNNLVVREAKTPSSAAQLAKQLTPDNTASVVSATREAQQMASKAIDTRSANKRTGMNSGNMMESGGFWIQYAYNDASQDEHDGVYGYDAKTHGFTLGMDTGLDDMTDVGLAYTYAKGDISGNGGGSGSSMDTENHILTLYSAFTQDEMFLDGQLSYSFGSNDGHRSVSGNPVKANYDSSSWGIGLTVGYTLPVDHDWSWQPLGAFNYYRIETDNYSESATLDYLAYDQVRNDNYSIVELGVGAKLMGDIQSDAMVFQPAFSLMAFHDFKDDPVTMTAQYAAGGNSFVVHGAKRDDTRFQFAASVAMELENNMTLSFNYHHDWMDNFKADGFIARLRYEF